jgi:hypothetical protein
MTEWRANEAIAGSLVKELRATSRVDRRASPTIISTPLFPPAGILPRYFYPETRRMGRVFEVWIRLLPSLRMLGREMSRGIISISESAPTLERGIPGLEKTLSLNGQAPSFVPEQTSRGLTESTSRGVLVYRGPRNRIQRGESDHGRRMETNNGKFPRIGVFQNGRRSKMSNRRMSLHWASSDARPFWSRPTARVARDHNSSSSSSSSKRSTIRSSTILRLRRGIPVQGPPWGMWLQS